MESRVRCVEITSIVTHVVYMGREGDRTRHITDRDAVGGRYDRKVSEPASEAVGRLSPKAGWKRRVHLQDTIVSGVLRWITRVIRA